MQAFIAIFLARNKEFLRDRSSLSWNIAFPILLVFGFSIIFSDDNNLLYKVGVIGTQQQLTTVLPNFAQTQHIQFVEFTDTQQAQDRVRKHQLDLVIQTHPQAVYWINSSSPKGYLRERILWGSGGQDFAQQTVEGKEIRYVDWVLPGILAMNMMFSCLFGVGYVIVRYRKNGYLKRLKATPLSAVQFLLAQMASRLILIQAITVFVYVGCDLFIDFHMIGSYWLLFFVSTLGSICLINMGLLVAARLRSEELAGGMLNLFSWPMMLLSGVWFSLEGSPEWVIALAQILPLTHLVEGARAIMTEGAGITQIFPELLALSLMSLLFLIIGALIFRWE